jgi:uncharacterized sulfatase
MQVFKWLLILLLVVMLGLAGYAVSVIQGYHQSDDEVQMARKEEYLRSIIGNPGRRQWPNIVLVVFDDLGYGDIGAFGGTAIRTPNLDRLAENGTIFTEYYSPSAVCSPSRAGMLTGRYPPRAGVPEVVFPDNDIVSLQYKFRGVNIRIPADEILLPEVLQMSGFNTGMVGKWHLGDQSPSLPNERGFDQFYGALYSNNMEPFALYRNSRVEVEAPADQTRLHERYTQEVIRFIEDQENAPFFLYYAHNFPHIPLYSSSEQRGGSDAGLYGDVVEDLDDSIGQMVAALEAKGKLENTLILITSDNGPWYQGSPGNRRGRKNQTWEGGQRVPLIAHWPGKVRAGVRESTPVSGIDLFPTLLNTLVIDQPRDRVIDGRDMSGPLFGRREMPKRELFYFTGDTLDAVRDERFKYHRERGVRVVDIGDLGSVFTDKGPWLFDLVNDSQESYDVSQRYPEAMQRLSARFKAKEYEMAENPRGWQR